MKQAFRKSLKILLILFIIFVSCIALIVGGLWGYQQYKHYQQAKMLEALPVDDTLNFENILQNHLDEKIGDDKMTIGEKLSEGLNPYVIDSSGNGVSDWDAIHTYGTDPHKFSTADDGISDYAKIKEGLDPTKAIDIDSVEEITIQDETLDVAIHTNNLNVKYHTSIEPYNHPELDELFQPVRQPVQLKDFDGEVELAIPENIADKDRLQAYAFNFENQQFEKINQQRMTDNALFITVDSHEPIYVIHDEIMDNLGTYYFFRLSGFNFTREALGFDHKVWLFRVGGLFTDEVFEDEVIEDVDYGVIEISHATVSRLFAWTLDKIYAALDLFVRHPDVPREATIADALFDYGKIEGTPDYVQRYATPWLYEHEELETENEWSSKVIDSGFRLKVHAFPFGNLRTTTGNNGVCAGFSRVTEHIYNGKGIEDSIQFEPQLWRSIVRNWLSGGEFSALQYDLTDQRDHFTFLDTKELFPHQFSDEQIAYLSTDTFVDAELLIEPSDISEPDQTLIEMLETQWIYSNEVKYSKRPSDPTNVSILDEVEALLSEGQIIYASLSNRSGGHTVSIYKMEYDKYDPDLIRFYVYDPNLPYQLLQELGTNEVYMNVYKNEKNVLFGVGTHESFNFDYTSIESHRDSYSYSSIHANHVLNLYHNDTPLHGKN